MRPTVIALLLLAPLLVGAAPASAATPESSYAATAVRATNQARVNHSLRALRTDDCLKRFAVRQAARMAAEEAMYHQELGPVLDECGLGAVGENVAYGYPTGGAVVRQGWLRSAGHRANILSRSYRLVAVGARRSTSGQWYVAQVFGRRA